MWVRALWRGQHRGSMGHKWDRVLSGVGARGPPPFFCWSSLLWSSGTVHSRQGSQGGWESRVTVLLGTAGAPARAPVGLSVGTSATGPALHAESVCIRERLAERPGGAGGLRRDPPAGL